MKLTKLN